MKILEKAESMFSEAPMSWLHEFRDTFNRSISSISMQEMLNFIVSKHNLESITSWSWEELHPYIIDFKCPSEITIITSCQDPAIVKLCVDESFDAEVNTADLLKKKGYVAIDASGIPTLITA